MTVKKNIVAGWLAHLVIVLVGFFLMPFILGSIGDAQYGAWVFINAIAGYSGLIYAGFGATICKYVAEDAARRDWPRVNSVVSTIHATYLCMSLLVLLAAGVLAWLAPSLSTWDSVPLWQVQQSILLVGCSIAIGTATSVFGGVLIGLQRIDLRRSVEVSVAILRLVLTITCLTQQWGLVTLAWIFLAVTIVENLLIVVLAYRQMPMLSVSRKHLSRETFRECVGFSSWNGLALVAEYCIFFTDTIVIGMILGPLAVVPYQIGLRITQMIQVPIAQIAEAVLPRAGQLSARAARRELGELVTRGMGLSFLLAGGFCIGAVFFGELLVRTWMGKGYPISVTVMAILLTSQVVALPMVVIRKGLLATGRVRGQVLIDVLEAVSNLGLSLILIRSYGVVGVAIGTLVPLLTCELCLLLPYSMRVLHLTREQFVRNVLLPQVPALAALLAFCMIATPYVPERGWGPLLLVTAAGGAVLVGTCWLTHRLLASSQRIDHGHVLPEGISLPVGGESHA